MEVFVKIKHQEVKEVLLQRLIQCGKYEVVKMIYQQTQDYLTVKFMDRVIKINNPWFKTAEMLNYFGMEKQAEEILLEKDRKDLLILVS